MKQRLGLMLAALWWGSLTGLGFVVVPQLFVHLSGPSAAGALAARLFTAQTWLGAACAMLLLLIGMSDRKRGSAPNAAVQAAIKFVVAGFLLLLLVEFGAAPRIVDARAAGGNLRLWHTLASAMLLAQWLCVGLALWHLGWGGDAPRRSTDAPPPQAY